MDVFVGVRGDCNSQQRPTLNTIGTFARFHSGPPSTLLGRLYRFTPAHPQPYWDLCTVSPRLTLNTIGTFVQYHPGPPSTLLGRLYCFTTAHPQHYWDGRHSSAPILPQQYKGICSLSCQLPPSSTIQWTPWSFHTVNISLPSATQGTVVFPHYWEGCSQSTSVYPQQHRGL